MIMFLWDDPCQDQQLKSTQTMVSTDKSLLGFLYAYGWTCMYFYLNFKIIIKRSGLIAHLLSTVVGNSHNSLGSHFI